MTRFFGNDQLVNNISSTKRLAKVEGSRENRTIGYEILESTYSPYVDKGSFPEHVHIYYILMDDDKYPVFIPKELAEEFIENEEYAHKFIFNERMQRMK